MYRQQLELNLIERIGKRTTILPPCLGLDDSTINKSAKSDPLNGNIERFHWGSPHRLSGDTLFDHSVLPTALQNLICMICYLVDCVSGVFAKNVERKMPCHSQQMIFQPSKLIEVIAYRLSHTCYIFWSSLEFILYAQRAGIILCIQLNREGYVYTDAVYITS